MRAIIFGVNGQDGHYLSELLKTKGFEVIGVARSAGNWVTGNVKDFDFVETLIQQHKPDHIYHLAANSTTRHDVLFENHETISTGSLNVLESVYRHSPTTKVFLSGSAMQFINNQTPISEQTPFQASSPYSIARIQSTYAARYYRSKGIQAYVGYFFNHESPLRTPRHVSRMIVDAVKRIEAGSTEKIEMGDIAVQKEWNFAGDFAEAMYILMSQNNIFETIIGSGKAYSIEHWLTICFNQIGKNWQDHVVVKNNFTPEYNLLISDPSLLFSLGYSPKVSVEELAILMLSNTEK